jgi:hypothetical protein
MPVVGDGASESALGKDHCQRVGDHALVVHYKDRGTGASQDSIPQISTRCLQGAFRCSYGFAGPASSHFVEIDYFATRVQVLHAILLRKKQTMEF